METPDFLQMRGIRKSYDGTQALRGVDFSAALGEVHAIVGENGAGKTTLVKVLAGAVERNAGDVLLDGQPVELDTPLRARRLGIRAVHQEFSLVPHLTVTENMLMGQMPTSRLGWWVDWPKAHRRAEESWRRSALPASTCVRPSPISASPTNRWWKSPRRWQSGRAS
jgi:ABC-type sugar transport system ATPase subunit